MCVAFALTKELLVFVLLMRADASNVLSCCAILRELHTPTAVSDGLY